MTTADRLPARVAAVLFDMDNTLVASEDAWFAAAHQLWDDEGGDSTGKAILGCTVQDLVDAFVGDFPDADPSEVHGRLTTMLSDSLAEGVRPMPGAEALITRLGARLPITIASNSPSEIVQQVVQALGWQHHFTAALGTEDVEHTKPAPDLYQEAARRCGVDPTDCVIFEDSPMGTTAARAAGAFVVTIGPEAAGMGDLGVDDLLDPRIVGWNPEVIS